MLWAKLIKGFNPQNEKSMALRAHCQTSGYSLTEQDPYNNVARTTIEALAAVMGGTQSLHTNSLDEAIALPTDFSARIARNTQLVLQHETDLTQIVDLWGGSYYVESLTDQLARKAWALIDEVEQLGGMARAIEAGLPKLRIEEAAARRQARIDTGQEIVVGVNAFKTTTDDAVPVLDVDTRAVREAQLRRLDHLRTHRDDTRSQAAMDALTAAAESGTGNLLELSVEAARARCSLGEISYALEKVYGRYRETSKLVAGVYGLEAQADVEVAAARALTDQFAAANGRRPRILVCKLGQDGHDRGAKVIATAFADLGFDVDVGALFQTPQEAAREAMENDVHVVGVSSLAGAHKTLVPELIAELHRLGRGDVLVVVGGVIPRQDYAELHAAGVAFVFGPGTVIAEAAQTIVKKLIG
jgi:methylmalonyl-CoA mutase